MSEQKKPEKNDLPIIADQVIEDIQARKAVGLERYGTYLQPFNGRSSVRDAYEEALDLTQYLKQMMIEREEMISVLHYYSMDERSPEEAITLLKKLGEL